jgi:hypothetical protein
MNDPQHWSLAVWRSSTLRLLATLVFVLSPACQALAQLTNENLLVQLPPGYKVGFQNKQANMQMTELVPASEVVGNWTEMVTIQIFRGLKTTPDQFRGRLEKRWLESCPGGEGQTIARELENGYQSSVWRLSCPRNPGTEKPEITYFKAVQGSDSFYLVQKAFKFAPSKEQVTQWSGYLRAVSVCDSRLRDRQCPRIDR